MYQNFSNSIKPITDSVFRSNIFTYKPYASTPFKKFITDSQFITFNSLIFNPASAKLNILPYPGICFNISIFNYIYFVSRVKPKPAKKYSLVTAQQSSSMFRNLGFSLPTILS